MKKHVFLFVVFFLNFMAFAVGRFSPLGLSWVSSVGKTMRQDQQFPDREDYVYGFRLAFLSGAHSRMVGLATAVFANEDATANGYVGGFQTASLFNTAGDCELGVWQISGFYNMISMNCNGFQVCSSYNDVDGYLNGLQVAIYNEVKSDCTGAQIGLFNRGGNALGLQIGVLNFAKSLQGLQVGVLNFVDESKMAMFPAIRIGW